MGSVDWERVTAADAVFSGIRKCGIRNVISLPDSVLFGIIERADGDPDVRHVPCTREDEGLAIAAGLWLGGELAAVLMEGSGLGYSGLILARMLRQRTPALVIASHNLVFGERHDYHAASRLAGAGTAAGLGIPSAVLASTAELADRVCDAGTTARSQREPIALLVAPSVMAGSDAAR